MNEIPDYIQRIYFAMLCEDIVNIVKICADRETRDFVLKYVVIGSKFHKKFENMLLRYIYANFLRAEEEKRRDKISECVGWYGGGYDL